MTLKEALKKYPKGMIYYHDNDGWLYLRRKLTPAEEERGEFNHLIVCDGEARMDVGYAPGIVVELAEALGIEVESV